MADRRTSRADTPRSRVSAVHGQRSSQAAKRRAASLPAVGSKAPGYILDYVLMTPRKRKRTSLHDDLPVKGASQTQRSRLSSASSPQKKASSRAARSRARTAEKETSSQTRSRNQKPPPSPIPPAAKTPGRRAASRSRTSRDSSAGPSSSTIRRATSRISEVLGKATLAVRKPPSSRRNKGTGKALPVNRETISHIDEEDLVDAEPSPPSGTRRPAKRRKLSPDESLETADSSTAFLLSEVDMDSQETAVEENFEMLDLPDDAYLPWVPIDPGSKESAYVPPGLNALIEDMKRALVLQISARQKAESMHAEELRRRCQLEEEAARLADANRALEAERSAWTASAAEALASTLESALVADMSRRLAAEIPLTTPRGEEQVAPETSIDANARARLRQSSESVTDAMVIPDGLPSAPDTAMTAAMPS